MFNPFDVPYGPWRRVLVSSSTISIRMSNHGSCKFSEQHPSSSMKGILGPSSPPEACSSCRCQSCIFEKFRSHNPKDSHGLPCGTQNHLSSICPSKRDTCPSSFLGITPHRPWVRPGRQFCIYCSHFSNLVPFRTACLTVSTRTEDFTWQNRNGNCFYGNWILWLAFSGLPLPLPGRPSSILTTVLQLQCSCTWGSLLPSHSFLSWSCRFQLGKVAMILSIWLCKSKSSSSKVSS